MELAGVNFLCRYFLVVIPSYLLTAVPSGCTYALPSGFYFLEKKIGIICALVELGGD